MKVDLKLVLLALVVLFLVSETDAWFRRSRSGRSGRVSRGWSRSPRRTFYRRPRWRARRIYRRPIRRTRITRRFTTRRITRFRRPSISRRFRRPQIRRRPSRRRWIRRRRPSRRRWIRRRRPSRRRWIRRRRPSRRRWIRRKRLSRKTQRWIKRVRSRRFRKWLSRMARGIRRRSKSNLRKWLSRMARGIRRIPKRKLRKWLSRLLLGSIKRTPVGRIGSFLIRQLLNRRKRKDKTDIYTSKMTKKEAKQVMKSRVIEIQEVRRPLKIWKFKLPMIKTGIPNHNIYHTGVVVRTKDGRRILIDKHASGKVRVIDYEKVRGEGWQKMRSKVQKKPATVREIAEACKKGYKLFGNNCQHSSKCMFNKGKREINRGG